MMRKIILVLSFFICSANIFASDIKPINQTENLFETPAYNQALVMVGFLGVAVMVGGFAYLVMKKKKS